jgi:hypothetical protein
MIIRVDIDGTICSNTDGKYRKAVPNYEAIKYINILYDFGNEIIYWTSRGSTTGIDWKDLTEKQLKKWKCKYHKLEMGKPFYDLLIDDKCNNLNGLLR